MSSVENLRSDFRREVHMHRTNNRKELKIFRHVGVDLQVSPTVLHISGRDSTLRLLTQSINCEDFKTSILSILTRNAFLCLSSFFSIYLYFSFLNSPILESAVCTAQIVPACSSNTGGMEQPKVAYNLCARTSWITFLPIHCSPVGVISAVSGARLVVDPPYIRRLAVWCVWLSVPSNGSLYTRVPATLTRACITFTKHTHTFHKPHDLTFSRVASMSISHHRKSFFFFIHVDFSNANAPL